MAIDVDKILRMVVSRDCSDIHFHVGRPPTVRLDGRLRNLDMPGLTSEDTEHVMARITPERCLGEIKEAGGADFAFAFENGVRFRSAVYRQRGNMSVVMRFLPNRMYTFEQIGLPMSIKNLLLKPLLFNAPPGWIRSAAVSSRRGRSEFALRGRYLRLTCKSSAELAAECSLGRTPVLR